MVNHDLEKYKGILVAIYACYNEHGDVDVEKAKALAEFYESKNVKGLYIGGSSGEGILQSVEERKILMKAVHDAVGDRLTIIAHVGAPATRDSIHLAEYAESIGVDAVSAVPSIYYGISEQAVSDHWQAIIDSTSLPFIIYHIPATTGFHLSVDLLKKMAAQPKVIGVKASTSNSYEIRQFKQAGGHDFIVYNGSDEQLLAGLAMGADGGIGGTYGMMPEIYQKLHQCFLDGALADAQRWQFEASDIVSQVLSTGKLNAMVKEIVRLRGCDCGEPRQPLPSLHAEEYAFAQTLHTRIMEDIQQLKN